MKHGNRFSTMIVNYWHTLMRHCPISQHNKLSDHPEAVWKIKTPHTKATIIMFDIVFILLFGRLQPHKTADSSDTPVTFGSSAAGSALIYLCIRTHRDNHPLWVDFRSHWQPPPHSVSNNLHVRLSGFVFQNVAYRIRPEIPSDDLLGTGHSFRFNLKPPVRKIVLFNGFIHLLILRKNNRLNACPSFFRRPFIIRTHQHCGCFEYLHNML